MWKLGSILVVLALVVVSACFPEDRPIPPGVYAAPSGEEYLTVGPSAIRLHFKSGIDEPLDNEFVDFEHRYEVRRNGVIHLHMSSNNFDPIEFDAYQWFWRDGRILRVERDTGVETWFAAAGDGR